MSDADAAAPVAGAGSAQEVPELPIEEPPTTIFSPLPAADGDTAPPLREDQIANAVSFLSHDKVRASADDAKRGFLERKGLTAAEIAEAFSRVSSLPAPPASAALAPYSAGAPPAASQPLLAPPPPQQHGGILAAQQKQQQLEPQGIRWTQVALGAGMVAATAYALNRLLKPYVISAYDRWTTSIASKTSPVRDEDAAMADKLAEAIQAQTAELRTAVAGLQETATAMNMDLLRGTLSELKDSVATMKAKGSSTDGEDVISKEDLRRELRSFATTLSDFSGMTGEAAELKAEVQQMRQLLAEATRSGAVGGGSPPRSTTGSVAMHTPFASPGAGSQYQSPGSAGKPDKVANGLPPVHHTEPVGDDAEDMPASSSSGPAEPPKPSSYTEILEMLEQGRTPPGIRTDINDKPPDPSQAPSDARLQPRPKPWERAASSNGASGSLPGRSPSTEHANGTAGPASGGGGAGPSTSDGGGWRPPPVPQPSLRLGKQGGSPAPSVDGSLAGSTA